MKNPTFCFTSMTIMFSIQAIDFLLELKCSTHFSLLNCILLMVAPLLQPVNIFLYLGSVLETMR